MLWQRQRSTHIGAIIDRNDHSRAGIEQDNRLIRWRQCLPTFVCCWPNSGGWIWSMECLLVRKPTLAKS